MWGSDLSAEQVHGFVAGYAFVTLNLVVDVVSLQRAGLLLVVNMVDFTLWYWCGLLDSC
jgi:hypothetical protein